MTVKKPTLCCPAPVEGPLRRSSEVLATFCTERQWKDWRDHGWLIAYGHLSGHAYRICHRHHPAARVQGRITWDLDDDCVIHCYDWRVPPAEEVLGVKLLLEHREPWIRNRSTGGRTDLFRNPLGDDFLDGTDSAGLLSGLGAFLQGALRVAPLVDAVFASRLPIAPRP